jgi:uncharacterized membrane protein YdjX (TVP38/TMEM64 family)
LNLHSEVEVVGRAEELRVVVSGIQEFRKDVAQARAGHNVGLLLRGVPRDSVVRGRAEVGFELGRSIALEPGMRFARREGGRTVGAGVVNSVACQGCGGWGCPQSSPGLHGATCARLPRVSQMPSRSPLLRWTVVAVLVLCFILVPFALFEEPITAWARAQLSRPPTLLLALLVGSLLASDVLLPVPSSLVGTASGALFGWAGGAAIAWAGMTIGCVGGFWLGRSAGRAGLRRFMGEREVSRAEALADRFGAAALVVSRPVPVLAEASVLFAGACGLPFATMLSLTALSNAGISLAYGILGAVAGGSGSFLAVFAAAVIVPALALGVARLGRR